jgi:ABC-type polysaccharide/polyol phosphate export permease
VAEVSALSQAGPIVGSAPPDLAAAVGPMPGDDAARPIRSRPTTVVRRSTTVQRSFVGEIAATVREIWEHRDLVRQLALRDLQVRYAQAVMGFAWAVLTPLLLVLAGMLIRYAIAQASGSSVAVHMVGATAIKALPWSFFSATITLATASLLANKALITKLYFPREAIPLATVLAQLKDLTVGAAVLVVALPFLGATASPALLWVPPLVLLLLTLTLASAVFLSCANLFFRDVKYIVQVMLTFGMFVTPIFYEPRAFGPIGSKLIMLNPLSSIVEGLRLSVIQGHNLFEPLVVVNRAGLEVLAWSPWYLAYTATIAVLGLLVSLRLFRRAAFVFAEYV